MRTIQRQIIHRPTVILYITLESRPKN